MYQFTEQQKELYTLIGLETGIEQGKEVKEREIALKMIRSGMSFQDIAHLIEHDEKWVIALNESLSSNS